MSDQPAFAHFWMVCRKPDGPRPSTSPKTRYRDKDKASAAAQRLADANNHPFIVLEAVEIYRPAAPSRSLF